jgi:protein phosphatase 2C family protein 2/3
MEDAHTQILSLNNDTNSAFFVDDDEHGGSRLAEYAGNHLHERIINQPSYSR